MIKLPANDEYIRDIGRAKLANAITRDHVSRIMNDLGVESLQEAIVKLKIENDNIQIKLDKYEPQVKKYRKKPVVVKAIRFTTVEALKKAFPDISIYEKNKVEKIYVQTLEGKMEISEGDYIIKGIKGEYYPCKPDIFEETYERV